MKKRIKTAIKEIQNILAIKKKVIQIIKTQIKLKMKMIPQKKIFQTKTIILILKFLIHQLKRKVI